MTFTWSNCAELSRNYSGVRSAVPSLWLPGRMPDVDPPQVLLHVHPAMGWRQVQVPPLQEEDTVSLAIISAGWWLLGACHHTPMTWVIHQVGVALGHPSSWSTTKVGFKKECSGVLWVASSLRVFTELLSEERYAPPDTATTDPSRDGDIWQQCWISHGGRHHHNHPSQTQDESRAAGLDAGGVPPKLHSDMHAAVCMCRCAMWQQKGHLLHCCCWGSWQPPLGSHCHSTEQEEPLAESEKAVPRSTPSKWHSKCSPEGSQQLLKRRERDLQGLSSKQEPSTTSVMSEGALEHG